MKLNLNRRAIETAERESADSVPHTVDAAAHAVVDDAVPIPAVVPMRPLNAVMPQGNARMVQTAEIAEIDALGARQALTALRTLQTFSYAVTLLLYRAELSYYITLGQDGKLWRALHAADFESAEAAFRHFEEQAVRLAEVELRRAQLEAQNQQTAAMIEASEAQAERLRSDLDYHAEQTQLVNSRQQQVRRDVANLEAQRVASQAHLNKTMRQIQQLRATSNERVPHLPARRADG
ncbi:DUF2968 domain-containing protein [Burkholderia ambifaria]|uniref:DUF2968 domain-containing protein n=1 Tax=Burkholderia ambifaria TaxID=152480 RepID=UPI001B941D5C|nr:DUF2968 domain-containing protein [Burkholderia ambifaria]MBR8334162.1 DUF2968 domain-containing protein [Burkholderia ambifaria]